MAFEFMERRPVPVVAGDVQRGEQSGDGALARTDELVCPGQPQHSPNLHRTIAPERYLSRGIRKHLDRRRWVARSKLPSGAEQRGHRRVGDAGLAELVLSQIVLARGGGGLCFGVADPTVQQRRGRARARVEPQGGQGCECFFAAPGGGLQAGLELPDDDTHREFGPRPPGSLRSHQFHPRGGLVTAFEGDHTEARIGRGHLIHRGPRASLGLGDGGGRPIVGSAEPAVERLDPGGVGKAVQRRE
jgi:hypothetical protein